MPMIYSERGGGVGCGDQPQPVESLAFTILPVEVHGGVRLMVAVTVTGPDAVARYGFASSRSKKSQCRSETTEKFVPSYCSGATSRGSQHENHPH